MTKIANIINIKYTKTTTDDEIKQQIIDKIKDNFEIFLLLDNEYKKDVDIFAIALSKYENKKFFAEFIKKSSEDFTFEIAKRTIKIFNYLDIKTKKSFAKKLLELDITHNMNILEYVDKNLLNDKKFMQKMIDKNSSALDYIGKNLRNDKEFIIKQLKKYGGIYYIYLASKKLQNDFEFILDVKKALDLSFSDFKFSNKITNNIKFIIKYINNMQDKIDWQKEQIEDLYDYINKI